MTIDKIKEKYLSIILSIVVIILNYKFKFSYSFNMVDFAEKSIDISSISFGFLLTVLALLLQSQSSALQKIKDNDKYNELINFNKKAVIASAVLAIISLLYVTLKPCITNECICIMFDCIVLGTFIYQIIEVYLFLDLFYYLIK